MEKKWQTRDEMPQPTNALQELHEILTRTSRDLSDDKMICCMYGIIVGYDDDSYEELKEKFGWTDDNIRFQKMWHENYEKAWALFMSQNEMIIGRSEKTVMDKITQTELDMGNHLIAEFCGDYFDSGNEPAYYIRENKEYAIKDAQFYSSWDWLMPVVRKLQKEFNNVLMGDVNFAQTERHIKSINFATVQHDIEVVWGRIVRYLEWINTLNNKNYA